MDRSAEVARYMLEMPVQEKVRIALLSDDQAGDEVVRRFPGITLGEVQRGAAITSEFLDVDRLARAH